MGEDPCYYGWRASEIGETEFMKIIVSREDIQRGQRRDPEDCPVARALRRAGIGHSGVMGAAITFTDEQQHTTLLLLPGEVQEWIARFDQGGEAEPFDFDLVLPGSAPQPRKLAPVLPRVKVDLTPEPEEKTSEYEEPNYSEADELELVEA
ncbi:MAG: hypothetical protein C5B50_14730 [Verrucomicrobia bacterium]|nr:MAG: hypothetical protein C5B50_14730 [Verrucomicrobiota bacterium]